MIVKHKVNCYEMIIKQLHLSMNMFKEKISYNQSNFIRYIGKESNELEQSEVLEVSKKDTMEYVNHQKKPRKIIANLTSEITLFDGSGLKQLISIHNFYGFKVNDIS